MKRARATFSALSSRNYRLFLTGQSISLLGTALQQTALGWLVYRMSGSSALLGLVGFCGQVPSFFLAPFAGVLADRFCKRKLIILTQIFSMLQAVTLGTLYFTGFIKIWHIPFLSFFLGIVNSVDIPVRQAFIIETVEKKETLGNALSLNSSMINITRIAGPALAGFLIAMIGEGACFYVNGASFAAVILSMVFMTNLKSRIRKDMKPVMESLKEGVAYALGSADIRSHLAQLALFSLTGVPFVVLLPVFAKDILNGGPHTLGFLMGATSAGALTGSLFLASRPNEKNLVIIRSLGAVIFGISLMGFSRSGTFILSLAMLFVTGFGMMVQIAASNTLIQIHVDDDKRGRVMSLFTMAFIGTIPFGSLAEGTLASRIGAPDTLAVSGFFCLSCAVIVLARAAARRTFAKTKPVCQTFQKFGPRHGRRRPFTDKKPGFTS